VADHLRAATLMMGDKITPANVDQGYILRRLLRRAIRHGRKLGVNQNLCVPIATAVIEKLNSHYQELKINQDSILTELKREEDQFRQTLVAGEKQFHKLMNKGLKNLGGVQAFDLYQTYGFPLEMTVELAHENNLTVDEKGFEKEFQAHQAKSREGAAQKFGGGLTGEDLAAETQLHTATHLLLAGLREVLGDDIHQAGSNINAKRLRFDFNHEGKVERDKLDKVEKYVNDAIAAKAVMKISEMNKDEAKSQGVEGSFWEKYPDIVKVFSFADQSGKIWSQELCGGPHVESTGELGSFKIKKEQSSSRGIRRIKAVITR
jgi:alanyl-tRNA synthetase